MSSDTSFLYCSIIIAWLIESRKNMVIVRMRLVERHQVLSYYDIVLYSNSRGLYSTVNKKYGRPVTRFRSADPTQPSASCQVMEIGQLGLMVTSYITSQISGTWGAFLVLHCRGRGHFHFWKRTSRYPRWRTEVEMAPAPFIESIRRSPYTTVPAWCH